MNAAVESIRGKHGQTGQQTTITLPYFDEEVPMLYLPDGTAYLPVRSLCRMFGLRAESHIPRWRKLVLWSSARKLPLQTVRGKRIVWCLQLGALPYWCACFNWLLVPAERREHFAVWRKSQGTNAKADMAKAERAQAGPGLWRQGSAAGIKLLRSHRPCLLLGRLRLATARNNQDQANYTVQRRQCPMHGLLPYVQLPNHCGKSEWPCLVYLNLTVRFILS